ncbi:hypothetical protein Afil01_33890 [Actinorhabdospora filicis]|uniref:Cupin type-2 domain-containing protein n=1 Tax=Actinorhabdospora filicis TaxID=1785913 RepID=A0A9W6SME1_9ACTN|nr:cupin domain-containing protein [Actinorhabdospora filicis]GLZ78582.1 hypothetical protein Afil01_33890 [Actinorhabdospora filicis]
MADHHMGDTPGRVVHVPAGGGTPIWLSGDVYSLKLGAADSGGTATFLEASVPPGGGPPSHVHADADEAFYLLAGDLDIYAAGEQYAAATGDFVFIPKGTAHRFHNAGTHTVKLLLFFTPAGVDRFFLEAGRPAVPGVPVPTAAEEDPVRIAEIGARYGLHPAPEGAA